MLKGHESVDELLSEDWVQYAIASPLNAHPELR
jgi:hypothetical protein